MKKIEVFDQNGKKAEDITLSEDVFGQKVKTDLLKQYLHIWETNQRQGTVSTKTRAEVRGGGKKPWRQKGTGRARHGSIRSPIWVHGGISHGPKPKSWSLSLPKKMKNTAMISCLSGKYQAGEIKVVQDLKFEKPNTKKMAQFFENLGLQGKTLLVLAQKEDAVTKSARNLPNAETALVENLNIYNLFNCKNVILTKESLKNLEKKYQ